jgi:hypothetical protein
MKLGTRTEDLEDLILTMLDLMKDISQQFKSSLGKSKTPLRTTLGEKTSLLPCFFTLCTDFILISHLVPSFGETGAQYPQFGLERLIQQPQVHHQGQKTSFH